MDIEFIARGQQQRRPWLKFCLYSESKYSVNVLLTIMKLHYGFPIIILCLFTTSHCCFSTKDNKRALWTNFSTGSRIKFKLNEEYILLTLKLF